MKNTAISKMEAQIPVPLLRTESVREGCGSGRVPLGLPDASPLLGHSFIESRESTEGIGTTDFELPRKTNDKGCAIPIESRPSITRSHHLPIFREEGTHERMHTPG